MNNFDNALSLLAKRYCERAGKKSPKQWLDTRKGSKNRKYVCHICSKTICSESSANPRTYESEEAIKAHGQKHLEEHGLADFI